MNPRIELRQRSEIVEDLLGKVFGMRGDERQPLQARQPRNRYAEIAEVGAAGGVAPGVHSLADEHDLARATRDALARFVEDRLLRPMIEATSNVRHDAERAIVGTTALHGYERSQVRKSIGDAVGCPAQGKANDVVLFLLRRSRAGGGISNGPLRELIAELDELARPENGVDVRGALLHSRAVLLGEASGNHQTDRRVAHLERFQVIHAPVGAAL